jgi:hypothetical protein
MEDADAVAAMDRLDDAGAEIAGALQGGRSRPRHQKQEYERCS